jgi:hypothetical protein
LFAIQKGKNEKMHDENGQQGFEPEQRHEGSSGQGSGKKGTMCPAMPARHVGLPASW